jgi:MFS family permease
MKTLDRTRSGHQKAGGLAALYLAAAYLLAMPFFLLVVDYPSVVDAAGKVALLAANQGSMHVMYLVTYVVFGIALAVLALALYQRLKTAAPVLMQVATAVGLLWAFALVASGMVFNAGMAAVVSLYSTEPGRAVSMWQAIEPVSQGLGGSGGELLGGLWVLLVSFAVLRGSALPRPLGWLGLVVGAAGLVSVIPALNDVAIGFGLLQIAWFVWLGVGMVRTAERPERLRAPEVEPA